MTPADLAKFEPQRRYATLVALAIEGIEYRFMQKTLACEWLIQRGEIGKLVASFRSGAGTQSRSIERQVCGRQIGKL